MKQLPVEVQVLLGFERVVGNRLPDPDVVLGGAVPPPHVRPRVLPPVLPLVRPVPVVPLVQTLRLVLALAQLVAHVGGAGEYGGGLVGIPLLWVHDVEGVPSVGEVDPRVVVVVVQGVAPLLARVVVGVGVRAELFVGLVARGGAAEVGDGLENFEEFAAEETAVVGGRVLLAPLLHSC